jgi:Protein of unknown function (DUF2934)
MSDLEQRIRERAYRIWLEESMPEGRENAHWDMATELIAIEDGQKATLKPVEHNLGPEGEPVEPIEALTNLGEFPTLTDQGEASIPSRRGDESTRRTKRGS